MNQNDRNRLINVLCEDEHFATLSSHRDRVQYLLEHHFSYGQVRESVKTNVNAARTRTGKSLTRAKLYKTEADMLARRADQDATVGVNSEFNELWDRALQSYVKVSLFSSVCGTNI